MVIQFNGDDGKPQGNFFGRTYFEGIHEAVITAFHVQKRDAQKQWVNVKAASPYDQDARIYLELTVGKSQFPNKYTIPGGDCYVDANGSKKQHQWGRLMTDAGLSINDDTAKLVGKQVKAVFYATAPNTQGQVFSNIWLLFRMTDSNEYIESVVDKSINSDKGLAKRIHPVSQWITGEPLEKPSTVEVELETEETAEVLELEDNEGPF